MVLLENAFLYNEHFVQSNKENVRDLKTVRYS